MDKMGLLAGSPYVINSHITVYHPTLGDIRNYGEHEYWQLVSMLTSTSYDVRFQLDDMGFDYEDIDDFTVFCMMARLYSPEDTRIVFGDLDLTQLSPVFDGEDAMLENADGTIRIDRIIYELIVKQLRDINGLKRNYKTAGNKKAREFHMKEERRWLEEAAKRNAGKEPESTLTPLISALVNNGDFKYDYNTVWQLPIYAFMDAARRISKIMNYRNVMFGIYSGNVDSKKIPKSQLNWMGEIDTEPERTVKKRQGKKKT